MIQMLECLKLLTQSSFFDIFFFLFWLVFFCFLLFQFLISSTLLLFPCKLFFIAISVPFVSDWIFFMLLRSSLSSLNIMKTSKVKDKERILKAAREKQIVTYRGVPIRLSADFSKQTLQARKDWQEIFKVIKSRDLQPRFFYPANILFRIVGQIKCFSDKVKLKEFIITKPLLYEMLKGLI